ncbi:MarR family transcriptional regulator [Flavivirga rizhaonensis]|uniref:MarR family transcriptional regulator n=2 Tax=Flavivirga rizhaonensis TaxID=2559571 RepID=A0A4S1E0L2_9FLAO|nr:MarR family transcriptional regulator [Flavivirga rizhaonensis]
MENDDIHIDFENSIGPWLGKTVKIIDYAFQEFLKYKGLDLTKEQMIVLKKLHDKNGLNQNELAFLTLRNKSSLTRLLSKMERKNYILRKQSTKDKRVNNVYLTQLGKEIFFKTKPIIEEMITDIESNISEKEKEQIINILKKIQSNFNSKIESL